MDITLEKHDDVRAAKLEESHFVAALEALSYVQCGKPVDAAYLGHADREHSHQTVLFSVYNGTTTGFDHLKTDIIHILIQLFGVVP